MLTIKVKMIRFCSICFLDAAAPDLLHLFRSLKQRYKKEADAITPTSFKNIFYLFSLYFLKNRISMKSQSPFGSLSSELFCLDFGLSPEVVILE